MISAIGSNVNHNSGEAYQERGDERVFAPELETGRESRTEERQRTSVDEPAKDHGEDCKLDRYQRRHLNTMSSERSSAEAAVLASRNCRDAYPQNQEGELQRCHHVLGQGSLGCGRANRGRH
jgi:hypothetical protein